MKALLAEHGVAGRRATDGDPTEEILLVPSDAFARVDAAELTNRLMSVLPHRKVWVALGGPPPPPPVQWRYEGP